MLYAEMRKYVILKIEMVWSLIMGIFGITPRWHSAQPWSATHFTRH